MKTAFLNEEKISRLPIWAQQEYKRLRHRIGSLENELSAYQGNVETNVFLHKGMENTPLPPDSRVRFKIGNGKAEVSINTWGELEVMTNGGAMQIMPNVSNKIAIKILP